MDEPESVGRDLLEQDGGGGFCFHVQFWLKHNYKKKKKKVLLGLKCCKIWLQKKQVLIISAPK